MLLFNIGCRSKSKALRISKGERVCVHKRRIDIRWRYECLLLLLSIGTIQLCLSFPGGVEFLKQKRKKKTFDQPNNVFFFFFFSFHFFSFLTKSNTHSLTHCSLPLFIVYTSFLLVASIKFKEI